MGNVRGTRPRLPGDPSPRNSAADRWKAAKVAMGAIALYVVYKIIDLAFERLGSLL
jgi:hypothetical protein